MSNNFGDFLKQKRQEKKLTQKELAKMLYVTESAVSKWEKNVSHPDITLLPNLATILSVTEHELITASVDKQTRTEKLQAKRWRVFSRSWDLFFYIAYITALIPCFICDLAINKSLTWFWIVLSALLFAFTFTNLPKLITKHKLILLPLAMYLSLCLLLGVCCIYTNGNWFVIPAFSVLFGLIIIFGPIYISKYKIFAKIKKYNDFVSIGLDYVMLNILLVVIYEFAIINGYTGDNWYLKIALPIVTAIYLFLNLLLSVRFLKVNKCVKTGVLLLLIDIIYLVIPVINVKNLKSQQELNQLNIFKSNLSDWKTEGLIESNVHCIIFLTMLALSVVFVTIGIIRYFKSKKTLH